MDFEDLQKTWQRQDAAPKITIDPTLLLKEVRRNQDQLRSTLFWRDFREVGVGIVLAYFFAKAGFRLHDWTKFLLAAACSGVAIYILLDRLAQRRKAPAKEASLKDCLEASLAQVNHQIWLLKNVAWWYILPLGGALVISSLWHHYTLGLSGHKLWSALTSEAITYTLLNWGVYKLNQRAVSKSLEPRRQELQSILDALA